MNSTNYKLCLVTGECARPLCEVVKAAVEGGCTMVQLREKHLPNDQWIARAKAVKQVLVGTGVPLIINDRVDIALAVNADGVHLGQSDMDVREARALLGNDKIIGLSVENMEQVKAANSLPVDYIGISPVFSTPTKTDTAQPFGLEGTRQAVALSIHPAIGIGGIHSHNVAEVMATGVSGVAVVSEIMQASDPQAAAEQLVEQASKHTYHRVLTIAGSDSGGGAGIQADIKTISACGCYAASAITAITVQNTQGVQAVSAVPLEILEGQIRAVIDDIGVDAIKIGMLHSSEVVHLVARLLQEYAIRNVVLDPVMVSTSGHPLIEQSAITALQEALLPLARVITPNIPEAELLLHAPITQQSELPAAAQQLAERYHTSVLLKAGHLVEEQLVDYLYDIEQQQVVALPSLRIHTSNTHGTGCTMSSALASALARGLSLPDAARMAKEYINQAIEAGSHYHIGHGFGPVHHFYRWW